MSGPMGFVYPVPGDTTNTWATVLNTLLGLAENHTHEPGKGNLVPTAGLNINADLTFASFAGTNLKALAFTEVAPASVTGYSDALYVNSTDHDLYFLNGSGVAVKLTDGNTINLSAAGSIGGDYATVGALLSYDDATHRYLFQQEGSPRPWAGAAMGNLDIFEQAASISNYVRIKSPSGLAAQYTMTLPTGLPVARTPLYLDQTGQISNTPRPMIKVIHAAAGQANPNIANSPVFSQNTSWNFPSNATPGVVVYPIALDVDAVITGFSVYMSKGSSSATTVQASLVSATRSTRTVIHTESNGANAPGDIVLIATGLSTTIADDGTQYSIEVQGPASSAADSAFNVLLTYTEAPY